MNTPNYIKTDYKNHFERNKYKIGQELNILDAKMIRKVKIIQIFPKKYYNMYLCQDDKNRKYTITDMDNFDKIND